MPEENPLLYSEKFKALSPEAQKLVQSKFESFAPEQREFIANKLKQDRILPPEVKNEPGLQDVSLTPLPKSTMERSAVDVAEGLTPIVGPRLAKVAGQAFEMIPPVLDTALTVGGTAGLAKTGLKAAPMIGKAATEGLESIGKAVTFQGAKEAEKLLVKQAELPLKQAAKRELAEMTKKEAGAAIGEAEKPLNIGLSKTSAEAIRKITGNKDKIAKFADRASRLAERGEEDLANKASIETLQFYRKTAQQALKSRSLDDITRNKLFQVNKTFGNAISRVNKPFGDALGRFKEIESVLKDLPKEFAKERQIIKAALVKAQTEAKKQARQRFQIGGVALTAGVAAGGRAVAKKVTGQ